MVWCKTEESARLTAVTCFADDDDVKSVAIGYDKNKKMWYVDRKFFTEEEYELLSEARG